MAEAEGKVSVEVGDKGTTAILTDSKGEEHKYSFPIRTPMLVADGDRVDVGTQLNEGSLYPAELLDIRGRTETEQYLVSEVQRVYKAQGVDINDKHIEVIVRQMMKRVRVDAKGSTTLLPGQLEDRHRLKRLNKVGEGRRRHPGQGRGGDPRDHQGIAGDGVVPLGRLLPGDDEGAHRRRSRGQARQARRPQGERDHRQADPGGDRASSTTGCSRSSRSSPPSARRRSSSTRRSSPRSSASPATARTRSSRASAPRSPRSSRSSRPRSSPAPAPAATPRRRTSRALRAPVPPRRAAAHVEHVEDVRDVVLDGPRAELEPAGDLDRSYHPPSAPRAPRRAWG